MRIETDRLIIRSIERGDDDIAQAGNVSVPTAKEWIKMLCIFRMENRSIFLLTKWV